MLPVYPEVEDPRGNRRKKDSSITLPTAQSCPKDRKQVQKTVNFYQIA